MNQTNKTRKSLSQNDDRWYASGDSVDLYALILDVLSKVPNLSELTNISIANNIWDIARKYKNLTGESEIDYIQTVYTKQSNTKGKKNMQYFADMDSQNYSITKFDFTRINNDTNGNPRYVTSFLNLLNDREKYELGLSIDAKYDLAVRKAKPIGGKRFSNKMYGGGIVFGSVFNLDELVKKINALI
jgi:hypothetical protein